MLTTKQNELYRLIVRHHEESGVVPSYEGMAEELGMKSKSAINRLVVSLEEKGFIKRMPNRARAIEPLHRRAADLDEVETCDDEELPVRDRSPVVAVHPGMVSLPVMGRIAAGVPTEAVEGLDRNVEVPLSMLGPGDHFALDVSGLSMIGAGIMDGDLAIVRRQSHAADGDIVVALVDGEEATLKRFRPAGRGEIALQAENPDFPTRVFARGRVAIQGKLVTVVRQYH